MIYYRSLFVGFVWSANVLLYNVTVLAVQLLERFPPGPVGACKFRAYVRDNMA